MKLSPDFSEALAFAAELHHSQLRKGTEIPYTAHLLAVAALVLEYGGTEDEAIAAQLQDAVEDQGGLATLEPIRRRFGLTWRTSSKAAAILMSNRNRLGGSAKRNTCATWRRRRGLAG